MRLIVLLLLFITVANANELKFVQAIWRHGDRAPGKLPYPNDVYNETYWPNGWEQLTSVGAKQMNDLGIFFKERYGTAFLFNEYRENEITIQSSKSKRALDSARNFVEGFCPTKNLEVVPVCPAIDLPTEYANGDPLLKPTSFDCPSYEQKALLDNKQFLADLAAKYKDLIDFLADKTGHGEKMNLHKAAKLNDLNREVAHGLRQPDWVYKTWPQYDDKTTLELVTEIKRLERTSEFNKPGLARLRGGFLLADWLKRAQSVAEGKSNPSKMMLYSSHDGTLQSLMYAMQIADDEQIPYAATVIMEIYQQDDGQFYVELYYRHDGELEAKRIPRCGYKCELNEFISRLNSSAIYSIEALDKECTLNNIINSSSEQPNTVMSTFPFALSFLPTVHLTYTIFNEYGLL